MLYDIEYKTLQLLKSTILAAKELKVSTEKTALQKPSIHVACQSGAFTKEAQGTWKCEIEVNVYILFQHFGNEDKRREGMSRIIWGVFGYLAGQKLGLSITALQPKEFRDVTDPDIINEGDLFYQLKFSTKADLKAATEEEATQLLHIGLNYYLQDPEDDDQADASDQVTLRSEE